MTVVFSVKSDTNELTRAPPIAARWSGAGPPRAGAPLGRGGVALVPISSARARGHPFARGAILKFLPRGLDLKMARDGSGVFRPAWGLQAKSRVDDAMVEHEESFESGSGSVTRGKASGPRRERTKG
jgi:hypothetical protein